MISDWLPLLCLLVYLGSTATCLIAKSRPVYDLSVSRSRRLIIVALIVAPTFFYGFCLIALRPFDAGNDTVRYIRTYGQLDGLQSAVAVGAQYYGNTEFLWWPLQSLMRPLLSPRGWLVANYLLVFGFVGFYYKKAATALKIAPAIFAFVFLTFFLVYAGNVMRQALAVPIGALGLFFFVERRYMASALLVLVATGLHWSAIVLFAVPVLSFQIFKRDWVYIFLPMLALSFSALSSTVVGDVVSALNIPGISAKFMLYFSSGHESHVGVVWKTANFWICSITSMLFLLAAKPSRFESVAVHKYTLLFISLVLFGINIPDFSERYIPFLLLVLPVQVALTLERFRAPVMLKNFAFVGFFLVLSALVVSADSSQYTLGYKL